MKKALLIEDDELTQRTIKKIFSDEFAVDVCDSAEYFYQHYITNAYDIIIMDISINGDKHGLDLTKELKQHPNFSQIPILCLTAHAFPKDRSLAMEAGVDMFLVKPVKKNLLKEAVSSLINGQTK